MNKSNQDKNFPLVSVIMSAYNAEKYIEDTIKSLLGQSYQNWELIIINNGSTDNTFQICNDFANSDSRIKIYSQESKSLPKTRNIACDLCAGEFLTNLDSDDLYFPDKLKDQVQFLIDNPTADMVFSDFCKGSSLENSIQVCKNLNISTSSPIKSIEIINNNFIHACSPMWRKSFQKKVGGFNELSSLEDWELWINFAKKGTVSYIPGLHTFYRLHESGYSSSRTYIVNRVKSIKQMLDSLDFSKEESEILNNKFAESLSNAAYVEWRLGNFNSSSEFYKALVRKRVKPYKNFIKYLITSKIPITILKRYSLLRYGNRE